VQKEKAKAEVPLNHKIKFKNKNLWALIKLVITKLWDARPQLTLIKYLSTKLSLSVLLSILNKVSSFILI
jgi:hypothetical protein